MAASDSLFLLRMLHVYSQCYQGPFFWPKQPFQTP